jgi:ATP-dependent protease ClpP protease subunit
MSSSSTSWIPAGATGASAASRPVVPRSAPPFDPWPFEPRPPLQQWRDGPTLWHEWARAALFERRTVLVDRALDDGMAAQAVSELMLLDQDGIEDLEGSDGDGPAPVEVRIDCEGGTVDAALTLVDALDVLRAPVRATCVGRADGPVLAVLAVADHRAVAAHARLRWGGESTEFHGSASELAARVEMQRAALEHLAARVARATRLTADDVRERIDRRAYVRVEDALGDGLVDEVLAPEARVARFPRRIGFERRGETDG